MRVTVPLLERLRQKTIVDSSTGCWLWQGVRVNCGHGLVYHPTLHGKHQLAHRISYELFVGSIPAGMCVLRRCDVPNCFNPAHLFLGTRADNSRDMAAKGRSPNTMIKRGHNRPLRKLTWEIVAELRSRPKVRGQVAEWAKEFGVGQQAIFDLLAGRTWKQTVTG